MTIDTQSVRAAKEESQLKRNIFAGSFGAAGSIVVSIIAYPLYLRFVGVELYGLWALLTVIIYFCSIGNFGIDEALIKYVAEEYERKNIENSMCYISTGINFLIVSGIIIYVFLNLLKNSLETLMNLKGMYASMFHQIFPYIILLSVFIIITNLINSILKAFGRFDQASYILLAGRIAALGFSFLFFLTGYTIWGLFWGQFLSFALILIVSTVLIYRRVGFYYSPLKNRKHYLVNLLKFGGTLTVSKILSILLEPFIKVVIARYIGLAQVTYFEIANKIVYQIRSLFERGISAIMPEVSRLTSVLNDVQKRIFEVMRRVNRTNSFVGLSVFVLLMIAGRPLLQLWLRNEFNNTIVIAFNIIVIGYLVNLLSIPSYYYFMGIGKVKYCFLNHLIQAVLNCILIVALLATETVNFELLIVAYSTSIAISAIALIIMYRRNISNAYKTV